MVNEEFVNRLLKNSKAFNELVDGREVHVRFNGNSFDIFLVNGINSEENILSVSKIFYGNVVKIAINDVYQLTITSVNNEQVMGSYEYFWFDSDTFTTVFTQIKCLNRDVNYYYVLENNNSNSYEDLLDKNSKKLITGEEYSVIMNKKRKIRKRIIGRINNE